MYQLHKMKPGHGNQNSVGFFEETADMASSSSCQQTTFDPAQGARWALSVFSARTDTFDITSTNRTTLENLPHQLQHGILFPMKAMSFREVKRQEAQSRMAAVRRARRSPRAAAAAQRRASLVGNGAKWRITNLLQVARAMSRWA